MLHVVTKLTFLTTLALFFYSFVRVTRISLDWGDGDRRRERWRDVVTWAPCAASHKGVFKGGNFHLFLRYLTLIEVVWLFFFCHSRFITGCRGRVTGMSYSSGYDSIPLIEVFRMISKVQMY